MKFFILAISLSLYVFAAGFVSVHQLVNPKGLLNEIKMYVDKDGNPTVSDFADGTNFIVTEEAHAKNGSWCGNSFPSYKIYIPAGLRNVSIGAIAKPNSSYYIWYAFVPDGSSYSGKTLPFKTKKMIDARVIYQKDNIKTSGWLYLRIIQASDFVYSQFGHIDNPRVYIYASYAFSKDMTAFNDWLKRTKFLSNGDPVESFDVAYEVSRYCSTFGEKLPLYGQTNGVLGSSLVSWLQTNDPVINLQSNVSTMPSAGSDIQYSIEYKIGDKAIEGISTEINSNTTEGVFFSGKLDDCVDFVSATKESGKDGYFVYSDNGSNWYTNKTDAAIEGNIHYVGFMIEDSNPSNGVLEQIFSPHETGSLKISVKTTSACSNKSAISYLQKMFYTRDQLNKEIVNVLNIQKATTSSTTTGATGGTSGGSGGTTTATNPTNESVDDDMYYNDSTNSNNNNSNVEQSNAQKECEAAGNKWVDGVCLQNSNNNAKNSFSKFSSSSSSSQEEKSDLKQDCLTSGGKWVDGVCLQNTKSSNSLTSSSSSSKEKRIVQVITSLEEKELPVAGYFARFGDGAFDWMYRTAKGKLYKLDGIDQRGYFQWTPLTPYFKKIELRDGKIILQKADTTTRNVDKRVLKTIEKITQKSVYPVNGYFTQYANGAFDWVYIDGQDMYKLEGLEPNGYFRWTPVGEYFQEVKVENYKRVIIGEIKKDKLCVINGGQWDEKRGFCFIYVASSSTSEESSSSRSSVNSSNSSNSSQTSSPFSSSSSSSSSSQKDEAGNGDFPSE